ncbi:MAG: hypothetical protein ACTFAL_06860 [Candidatus Electronema sp. V4]|uniref:hypothetical protein n=1 Tax=Candidatus Electronema sp. V4 TaxID=3454756 RepID=UPI0040556E39
MNRMLIVVCSVLLFTEGCDCSPEGSTELNVKVDKTSTTVPVDHSADQPNGQKVTRLDGVVYTYIRLRTDNRQLEKQAEFTIKNTSKYTITGFSGELVGYDQENKKVYSFPWSQSAYPALLEIGEERTMLVGFKLPDTIKTAEFIAQEYEVR